MKRTVLAIAAVAALTVSAPAVAVDLDRIVGGIAEMAIGQMLKGATGMNGLQDFRRSRSAEPYLVDDSLADRGYGSVYAPYDRYSDRLSDIYGARRVERCGADKTCARMAVGLIRNDEADRLDMLFSRIRG